MFFLPDPLKPYAKAIVPALVFFGVLGAALSDLAITEDEVKAIAAAGTLVASVYFPRNVPAP